MGSVGSSFATILFTHLTKWGALTILLQTCLSSERSAERWQSFFILSRGKSVGSPPATILLTHLTKWDALAIPSASIVFF